MGERGVEVNFNRPLRGVVGHKLPKAVGGTMRPSNHGPGIEPKGALTIADRRDDAAGGNTSFLSTYKSR